MLTDMRLYRIGTAAVIILLAACAAEREVLIAKSAAVPAGVDFSGQWTLAGISADSLQRIAEAERKAAGGDEKIVLAAERQKRQGRSRRSDGAAVHVFIETGQNLKITQTPDGIFISFDRAVVEEYRFGEQREISVGPVIADRVSGWEGGTYVVETLDQENAKLIETFELGDNGQTLVRTLRVIDGEQIQLDVRQVFNRN